MLRALGLVGGKYRLEQELGRGASGAVYGARSPSGELVAVKILSRLEETAVERFQREAQLLVSLPPHPGVVRVLDTGRHGELPYLVLEHMSGGSLAKFLEAGRWPNRAQALALVEKVLQALAHLHRHKVAHRDVNANNILLDARGEPRLVDFGLALDLDRITRLTQANDVLGTAHGLAPEQLDGKSGLECDVYAAASLLYLLLSKRPPFVQVKTFRELTRALRSEEPPALEALDASIPRELSLLVARGLAKKPADRPTAEQFAELLGPRSQPPPPAERGEAGRGASLRAPYQVLEILGTTPGTVVFRARRSDGTEVAIKSFRRPGPLPAAPPADGFVPILETGTNEEGPFIVMPLMPSSLASRLAKGPLTADEALAVARPLAETLARAHLQGVIHRGVKSSNVFFTEGGKVLLSDLGRPDETASPTSDVLGFGETLRACLAGRAPTEIPPWLVAAVARCTAPSPSERPGDGVALVKLLEGPRPPVARRVALVLLLLAALVTSLAIVLKGRRTEKTTPPETPVAPVPSAAPPVLDELPEPWRSRPQATKHLKLQAMWGSYWLHHRYGPDVSAISRDGRYALVTGNEQTFVWDLDAKREVCALPSQESPVHALGFARDGLFAVTQTAPRPHMGLYWPDPGRPPAIYVWELPKGELVRRIETWGRIYQSVLLTPRGERVIAAGGGVMKFWDVSTGKEEREVREDGVTDVALDDSGVHLLARSASRVRLFDVRTGLVLASIDVASTCAALSSDGKRVVTGDRGGNVTLHTWNHASLAPLKAHDEPVARIALGDDGRVYSAGARKESRLAVSRFEPTRDLKQLTIPTKGSPPRTREELHVAFDPVHQRALVSGWGSTLRLLEFTEGDFAKLERPELETLVQPAGNVLSLAVSQDGTRAASGTEEGMLHLWSPTRGSSGPVAQLRAAQRREREDRRWTETHLWSLAFVPSGEQLLATGWDERFKVFATENLREVRDYPLKDRVSSLAVSPSGDFALTSSWEGSNGRTQLWSKLRGGKTFYEVPDTIEGGARFLSHTPFLGDGSRAIAATDSRTLTVIEVPGRKVVSVLRGHSDHLCDVAASASGRRVVSVSHAGEVFIWDLGPEREPRPRRCSGHAGCATSVLVTRDGSRAITSGWDGKIRLWDLEAGAEVEAFSLAAATDVAWSLAMGPEDRWFLAGTERGVILRFELLR